MRIPTWRELGSLLFLTIITAATARATETDPLSRLPHRRAIQLEAGMPGEEWIVVHADDALAAATGDFADVRVSDSRGRLVPHFTISPRETDVRWRPIETDALTWHDDPRAGRVMDFRIEPSTEPVLVVLTGTAELMRSESPPIRVLGGRDGRRWRRIEAPISTMSDLTGSVMIVTLPARSPRFIRLVAPTDAERGLPEGSLYTEAHVAAPRDSARFTSSSEWRDRQWCFSLELAAARAVAGVVLASSDDVAFWRPRLELEVAGDRWRDVPESETRVYRDATLNHVTISPTRATGVRVRVAGAEGTRPPVTPVAVEVVPTRIVVRRPDDAEALWINYGDPLLESTGATEQPLVLRTAQLRRASLGPEVANPAYSPPGLGWEWARRHPAVLTIVMTVILALIAAIVLRDARRSV